MKSPSYAIKTDTAWSLQEDKKQLYKVLKQDDEAHVVKFGVAPDSLAAMAMRFFSQTLHYPKVQSKQ